MRRMESHAKLSMAKWKRSKGLIKDRPSDYFEGHILKKDKKVSKFYGTYCGFLDFDGVRYWDGRHMQGFKIRL